MESHPLVTIGIPNYNYARFIIKCLNSIVLQTYENIQIIVVDDCSTDDSIQKIEEWMNAYKGNMSVRLIKNSVNLGLTKNCNLILKNAQGKYFQPLDADDYLLPTKIEKQVGILENDQYTAMVYSNTAVINEIGEITNPDYCARIRYDKHNMPFGKIKESLLIFNFISLPSVLINTEYARQVGGFDENLRVQDYYMWLKLAEKYLIRYIPETLAYYRVHSSSMSSHLSTSPASADSVLKIRYHYYQECDADLRKILARGIQFGSVFLYKNKYPSAKKWLKIAFKLNPGLKPFIYSLAIRIGVPFSFFEIIKGKIALLKGQTSKK